MTRLVEVVGEEIQQHPDKLRYWQNRFANPFITELDTRCQKEEVLMATPPHNALIKAFTGHGKVIVGCADEGIRDDIDMTPLGITGSYHFVHIAGSGTLNPEIPDTIPSTVSGIYGISVHEGCGAAAILAQKLGRTDVNTVAQEFAKEKAKKLDTRYIGMIPTYLMQRPQGFHTALGIYLDSTGNLDQTKSPYFPSDCFTLTLPLFGNNLDAAAVELERMIELVQSEQTGLGLRTYTKKVGFSYENPFYIFTIGKSDDSVFSTEKLVNFVHTATRRFPATRVVGFNAP